MQFSNIIESCIIIKFNLKILYKIYRRDFIFIVEILNKKTNDYTSRNHMKRNDERFKSKLKVLSQYNR